MGKIKLAGYVKLAKLWEKHKEEALSYHHKYYNEQFRHSDRFELVDMYIDITGNKDIVKRPEMVRLLRDCRDGKIECIATQTKAYLAANSREFMYLFHLLRKIGNGIDIVTEDMDFNINTVVNPYKQIEELEHMAASYIALNPPDYESWESKILNQMDLISNNTKTEGNSDGE